MSDISLSWLIVIIDASVKAILLAIVASVGLRSLRVRDSNLRHRIWMGVLCGMLLLPGLAQIVPALQLPFHLDRGWFANWQFDVDSQTVSNLASASSSDNAANGVLTTSAQEESAHSPFPAADGDANLEGGSAFPVGSQPWPGMPRSEAFPNGLPPSSGATLPPTAEALDTATPTTPSTSATEAESVVESSTPPTRRTLAQFVWGRLPIILWSIWLIGAAFLALRILAGLVMAALLKRKAQPIDRAILPSLALRSSDANRHHSAADKRSPDVELFVSSEIRVPLTLGVFHPQILLPPDWVEWPIEKLQSVLVHEQTHAARGDCALALLAEINRCLYWFHPLAWWLKRWLSTLAESACDDAAISTLGDRTEYARHLLEVAAAASLQRGRLVVGVVSMSRLSNVETRIDSILDFTRPLSQRLTRGTVLALLGIIIPLIGLAAALRPGSVRDEAPAVIATNDEPESTADVSTIAAREDQSEKEVPTISDNLSTPSAPKVDRYFGRVVDHLDQPLFGVSVYVPGARGEDNLVEAETDEQGRFEFKLPDQPDGRRRPLIATHPGRTVATYQLPEQASNESIEMRLQPEHPIAGRMIDGEGRPIVGAAIGVYANLKKRPGALNEFFVERRKLSHNDRFDEERFRSSLYWPKICNTTTDSDGRFIIHGIDVNDLAWINIAHDDYVTEKLIVANVPGLETTDLNHRGKFDRSSRIVGPDFTHVGVPGLIVEGRVMSGGAPGADLNVYPIIPKYSLPTATTDADGRYRLTGLPRGVEIRLSFGANQPQTDLIEKNITFSTGLEEARKTIDAELIRGSVEQGTLLAGRVIDPQTGQGVQALLNIVALPGNEFIKQRRYQEIQEAFRPSLGNVDGEFRIPVIPGPCALMVTVNPTMRIGKQSASLYRAGVISADDKPKFKLTDLSEGMPSFAAATGGYFPLNHYQMIKYVDLAEGEPTRPVEIVLDRGQTLELEIVDPDGKPVTDVTISGLSSFERPTQIESERTTLYGLSPESPRSVIAVNVRRQLAGVLSVTGEEPAPIRLTLNKFASVRGRAVDSTGRPLAELHCSPNVSQVTKLVEFDRENAVPLSLYDQPTSVHFDEFPLQDFLKFLAELHKIPIRIDDQAFNDAGIDLNEKLTLNLQAVSFRSVLQLALEPLRLTNVFENGGLKITTLDRVAQMTNKHGVFQIENLVPGIPVELLIRDGDNVLRAQLTEKQRPAQPGQQIDLGDVVFLPPGKKAPPKDDSAKEAPKKTANGNASADSSQIVRFRGRVLDPDGRPLAGAKVYALRSYNKPFQRKETMVNAEVQSAADGTFEIQFDREKALREVWPQSQSDHYSGIAAVKTGFGPAFASFLNVTPEKEFTLQMVRDDVPVTGRLLNPEGKPLAGVKISVRSIWHPKANDLSPWLEAVTGNEGILMSQFRLMNMFPDAKELLPSATTTDKEGNFRLTGIGRDRCAELELHGSTVGFAQNLFVTRAVEKTTVIFQRGFQFTRPLYGSHLELVALRSKPIVGRVIDAETQKPLAGISIVSWKFGDNVLGSHPLLSGQTDEAGEFRLEGMPSIQGNKIAIISPTDQPYFGQLADVEVDENLDPRPIEFRLHRGIWITGKVTDKETGVPVPAYVNCIPFRNNETAKKLTSVVDVNGRFQSPSQYRNLPDGTFRVLGVPGRSVICATVLWSDRQYLFGIGSEKVDGGKMPQLPPGMLPPTVMQTMSGLIANTMQEIDIPQNAPSFTSNLELDPGDSLRISIIGPDGKPVAGCLVRGISAAPSEQNLRDDQSSFDLVNLVPGKKRAVFIRHAEKHLGKALLIDFDPNDKSMRQVQLEPLAVVNGRALTADGDPVGNESLQVMAAARPYPEWSSHGVDDSPIANDGRFRLELPVGCRYTLAATQLVSMKPPTQARYESAEFTPKPGETIDLGDVRLTVEKGQ